MTSSTPDPAKAAGARTTRRVSSNCELERSPCVVEYHYGSAVAIEEDWRLFVCVDAWRNRVLEFQCSKTPAIPFSASTVPRSPS